MSVIEYNNSGVFPNQQSPLVSKQVNYQSQGDNRVLEECVITLRGEITGCGIDELASGRSMVIDTFSESFKDLYISGVDTFSGVRVRDISFDQSPYLQVLPYTISLSHYPSGGFEFAFGVANPVSQWTYTQEENDIINISHSASAKGINTDFSTLEGNALDNAKNFVISQLTGAWEIPRPYIIDTKNTNFKSYLTSFNQSIDKLSNSISVQRNFRTDPTDIEGNVILRYTEEISETQSENIKFTYNGTIDAGATNYITNYPSTKTSSNLADIRSRYQEFKNGLLTTNFLTENVTEDTGINRLSFSLSFNSGDSEPSIIDDFSITVEENSDSSLVSVSINGNLSPKDGCFNSTEISEVLDAYQGNDHKFQICDEIYNEFYTTSRGSAQSKPANVYLNAKPLSTTKSVNEKTTTVSYTNNLNDRNLLIWENDADINNLEYNMIFSPSLQALAATPSASKTGFIFQDLGYSTRASFSISASSKNYIPSGEYIDFSKSQFNKMTDGPKNIYLESQSYKKNLNESSSFDFTRSFDSRYQILDVNSNNYTGLSEFRI